METVLVYDSKFGNTRQLATAMAEAVRSHGTARIFGLDRIAPAELGLFDLLIIGGPTQEHGLSARMRQFTDRIEVAPRRTSMAAAFDTRYRLPAVVSGSAARAIARRLKRKDIRLVALPESFFVGRTQPPQLEAGELERAASWAAAIANRCSLSLWCAA